MAKVLTARSVEAMKPDPGRRLEVPDAAMPGLYLVVQPSGARSWAYRYRVGTKPRKLTIGRFPGFSLAQARERAGEAAQAVELGMDPGAAKATAKARAREAEDEARDQVRTLVEQMDGKPFVLLGIHADDHTEKAKAAEDAKKKAEANK